MIILFFENNFIMSFISKMFLIISVFTFKPVFHLKQKSNFSSAVEMLNKC